MTKQEIRKYAEKLRKEAGIKKFSRKIQAAVDAICEKNRRNLWDALGKIGTRCTRKEALLLTLLKWIANVVVSGRPDGVSSKGVCWQLGNLTVTCGLCYRYGCIENLENCGRCLIECDVYGPWGDTKKGKKRRLMSQLRKAWKKLCN